MYALAWFIVIAMVFFALSLAAAIALAVRLLVGSESDVAATPAPAGVSATTPERAASSDDAASGLSAST